MRAKFRIPELCHHDVPMTGASVLCCTVCTALTPSATSDLSKKQPELYGRSPDVPKAFLEPPIHSSYGRSDSVYTDHDRWIAKYHSGRQNTRCLMETDAISSVCPGRPRGHVYPVKMGPLTQAGCLALSINSKALRDQGSGIIPLKA